MTPCCALAAMFLAQTALQDSRPASAPAMRGTLKKPSENRENRLAGETSPYLLQHKDNPVDWHPWGPEALAKARELDRPIFLSIGYAACHWCHVMEHESFEDERVAQLMNEAFVNVKVDREERPDLDEIYMSAVQLMTQHGGWPMSVWLTPELQPFFAGTYFPPEDRYGQPGFARVLQHVDTLWKTRREEVRKASAELTKEIARHVRVEPATGEVTLALTDRFTAQSAARFDEVFGGWAGGGANAPKFPHPMELSLLLRLHARKQESQALAMVEKTLEHMARGGMYDHLGGGFHRYSTDRQWLVPHFEKMLYDNAQLARVYAEAHLHTGSAFYADVARETCDYLLREMRSPEGGFWSTQDADSEGEEGKFFVWSLAEFERVAGPDAEAAALWFGVTQGGNWEGTNILTTPKTPAQAAALLKRPEREVRDSIEAARRALLAARERRIKPGLDDKCLAAWNGLAISAFARCSVALAEPRYLDAATGAAEFVWTRLRTENGRLLRSWRRGEAKLMAYLEDYAFMIEGLLDLFEAGGDPVWLARALELERIAVARFLDRDAGGFFFTADDHEELVTRAKQALESSIPSGNAVMALVELRLAALTGEDAHRETAVRTLSVFRLQMERYGPALSGMLSAVEFLFADPPEVVVTGPAGDPGVARLAEHVRRRFPPHHALLVATDATHSALAELTALLAGRPPGAEALAYVCRRGACQAPVRTVADLAGALGR
jgi:uncharacterized protein YyaL (SSP411 family)